VSGNFPLNDDWSYSKTVKFLYDYGKLEFTGWTSMTLAAQVFWGYIWSLLFGFSFEVLRYSTLFLSTTGLFFLYLSARQFTGDNKVIFTALALLGFNTVYFFLSASFMTDVPFLVCLIISMYFFLRYLKNERFIFLYTAFLFCVISVFIRQLGLVIIFSFTAASFLIPKAKYSLKVISVLFTISVILLLVIFQQYIRFPVDVMLSEYTRSSKFLSNLNIQNYFAVPWLMKNFFYALVYTGLFLAPLLILKFYSITSIFSNERIKRAARIFILLFPLPVLWLLDQFNKLLPARPNIIFKYGAGPALLKDVDILGLQNIEVIPRMVWLILTYIGVWGGILLCILFWKVIKDSVKKEDTAEGRRIFLFVLSASFLVLYSFFDFYDRYIIVIIPSVILLLIGLKTEARQGNIQKIISYSFVIIMVLFSTVSLHDYFDWNRERWRALEELTEENKISPHKIDGGFEFNGWYNYDPEYRSTGSKSWWWVNDDEYILSFGTLPGYRTMKSYTYERWLFMTSGEILDLKRSTF
jgi:hypothetical protein